MGTLTNLGFLNNINPPQSVFAPCLTLICSSAPAPLIGSPLSRVHVAVTGGHGDAADTMEEGASFLCSDGECHQRIR